MLLDLDQGSMTVWKNGIKLGVMAAEGLSGPYCWAVGVGFRDDGARIESVPAPASPTEEELAAARDFARRERRQRLDLPLTATHAECEAAAADEWYE